MLTMDNNSAVIKIHQPLKNTIMNKRDLWVYRISTGLMSLMFAGGGITYFAMNEMVTGTFTGLGFASFIVYPLGAAKILGVVAILTNKSATLKSWAYAGFVFVTLLAAGAHLNVGDGQFAPPLVALVFTLVSYVFGKKVLAAKA
jgi:hypothetical protein